MRSKHSLTPDRADVVTSLTETPEFPLVSSKKRRFRFLNCYITILQIGLHFFWSYSNLDGIQKDAFGNPQIKFVRQGNLNILGPFSGTTSPPHERFGA